MVRPDPNVVKPLLDSSHAFALLLPQNPKLDAVSSALSLKLVLEQMGKSALVVCQDAMTVEFNRLVGIDTVTHNFGGRNLVISFPGQTEVVDKVSYAVEQGELQLVITPKSGTTGIDHKRLKFIPAITADTIILIDVNRLTDLGSVYAQGKDTIQSAQLIALTRNIPQETFAHHHLYDPDALSLVESALHLIESLQLPLSSDAASNLLLGLENSTQNFQHPGVSASSFDAAAKLIRHGARRQNTISASDFPPGSIPEAAHPTIGTSETVTEVAANPPSDWLAPKVYRSPMLQ